MNWLGFLCVALEHIAPRAPHIYIYTIYLLFPSHLVGIIPWFGVIKESTLKDVCRTG